MLDFEAMLLTSTSCNCPSLSFTARWQSRPDHWVSPWKPIGAYKDAGKKTRELEVPTDVMLPM